MKNILKIIILNFCFIASIVKAQFLLPANYSHEWLLTFGVLRSSGGEAQVIPTQLGNDNTYLIGTRHQIEPLVGIHYFYYPWQKKVGVGGEIFYLKNTTIGGNAISQTGIPIVEYNYDIKHLPFYLTLKTHSLIAEGVVLILNAGVGVNYLTTTHYREVPLTSVILSQATFYGKTNMTWSGTFGFGLRIRHWFDHLPVEIGYRFFYLGQGQLNPNLNFVSKGLKTGKNYANTFIFSFYLS